MGSVPEGCEPRRSLCLLCPQCVQQVALSKKAPKPAWGPQGTCHPDKQVCLSKVKSHVTHEEHVIMFLLVENAGLGMPINLPMNLLAWVLVLLRPFLLKWMIGFLPGLKKLTMWMLPRISYWLTVEAAVPKRVMFGHGAKMPCVVTLGICQTWKSWLPCPRVTWCPECGHPFASQSSFYSYHLWYATDP